MSSSDATPPVINVALANNHNRRNYWASSMQGMVRGFRSVESCSVLAWGTYNSTATAAAAAAIILLCKSRLVLSSAEEQITYNQIDWTGRFAKEEDGHVALQQRQQCGCHYIIISDKACVFC